MSVERIARALLEIAKREPEVWHSVPRRERIARAQAAAVLEAIQHATSSEYPGKGKFGAFAAGVEAGVAALEQIGASSPPAVSGPWIVREDKHLGEPNPRSSWSVVRPLAVQGTWDVTACAYMTSREECEVVARALNEYAAAQAPQEESR